MARTNLTKTTALGSYPALPLTAGSAKLTMTAADVANKNQFTAGGNDLVVAHNTGVGAGTVTVTSAPDEKHRTGDIAAYSIPAGEHAVFGPLKTLGWVQADGKVYLEASTADIVLGVVAL